MQTETKLFSVFNGGFSFGLLNQETKSAAYLQQKREEDERSRLTESRTPSPATPSRFKSRIEGSRSSRERIEMTRGSVSDSSISPPRELHNRNLLPVAFVWPYEGEKVAITGSFTNWKEQIPLLIRDSNEWKLTLKLPPGVYTYKFVVDGVWCYDMQHETTRDPDGNVNNVVRVERENGKTAPAVSATGSN